MFFLVSVVLIIAVLSAILYVNFERIMLNKLYGSELEVLSQISFSLNYLRESSLNTSMQIYSNPDIAPLLFYSRPDERTLLDSLNRLSIYRRAATFISSIYIYNRVAGKIYADSNIASDTVFGIDDFYDHGALEIIRNYRQYDWFAPIPRKIPIYLRENKTDNVYSFVFYDTSVRKKDLDYAIVLNVSAAWLNDLIKSLDALSQKEVIIVDRHGIVFSSTNAGEFLMDLSGTAYVSRILGATEKSGFLLSRINAREYFVSFLQHNLYRLTLIRTIPYDRLIVDINKMKRTTLIVCFGVLLLGLLVSLSFLKFVKKAFKVVIDKLEAVERRRKAEIPVLRNDFLKNIALGKSLLDQQEYSSIRDELGLRLDPFRPVAAVLFLIDGYYGLSIRLGHEETQDMRRNIKRAIEMVFSESYVSEVIDMEEERILLILNVEGGVRDQVVSERVREVQGKTMANGGISVSAIITEATAGLAEANRLFESAMAVSNNKIFTGHGSVLWTRDYARPDSDVTAGNPPMKEVKRLIESLLKANLQETLEHYAELLDVAKREQYESFHIIMTRLAFEIHVAVGVIKRDFDISIPFSLNLFLKKLQQVDRIEEINEMYRGLFTDIIARLQQRKSGKHDQIAGAAMRIIKETYADINLSVESVSREVNISTAYLGKIFREVTGKSMPSFINEVRMENACGLLLGTREAMDGIARSVGYTNTIYFHRMFKRLYGMTPLKYRRVAKRYP